QLIRNVGTYIGTQTASDASQRSAIYDGRHHLVVFVKIVKLDIGHIRWRRHAMRQGRLDRLHRHSWIERIEITTRRGDRSIRLGPHVRTVLGCVVGLMRLQASAVDLRSVVAKRVRVGDPCGRRIHKLPAFTYAWVGWRCVVYRLRIVWRHGAET